MSVLPEPPGGRPGGPEVDHTPTPLGVREADELYGAMTRSPSFLRPWVLPPASLEEARAMLAQEPDVRIAYGVRTPSGDLAAVLNLTSIIRGPFQNCFLSYYALVPHEARGYVRAGLLDVLELAFTQHSLHRVEVSVQPANERSARLVQGVGFRFEGRSPRYLFIDGAWRDHDRYALTVEDWRISHRRPG